MMASKGFGRNARITVVPVGCLPDQFLGCDVEGDFDVDLADYMLIQPCFSGSGVQGDVN